MLKWHLFLASKLHKSTTQIRFLLAKPGKFHGFNQGMRSGKSSSNSSMAFPAIAMAMTPPSFMRRCISVTVLGLLPTLTRRYLPQQNMAKI
jgi:hypothetical protein